MSSPSRPGRRALSVRFLIYFAAAYAALVGLMGLGVMSAIQATLVEDLTSRLETDAMLAAESMPPDSAGRDAWAQRMFETGGFRVTVVDTSGVVVTDSHTDPAVMENHADRPEIMAALSGEIGNASRVSASTGFEQHYVALPPEDGLIVRVSLSERAIRGELDPIRNTVLIAGFIAGIIGIAIVAVLARRLARPIGLLTDQAKAIAAGETSAQPRRSPVRELDELGLAIASLVGDLRRRMSQAEGASATLETVLGALPQGTILFSAGDKVAYANPAAHDLLGAVPADLSGLAPLPFHAAVTECRRAGARVIRDVDHGTPVRRLRGLAVPLAEDERVLLIVIDVTARERAAAVRRDFVANASHELKTPVSTIVASSEALRMAVGKGDDTALEFAAQIEASARQLDSLVADLLDLSRLEREEPDRDPVGLDLLITEEVERVRPAVADKGIALVVATTAAQMRGSRRDLAIAIRNILDNAVRYTGRGGEIHVSLARDGQELVLAIRDTGEGIPTRDLGRIFERFYRVDAARSRLSGGTGLGLSIVKHVVEGHGGAVEVASELGQGSTFTVRLPLAEDPTPDGN
jgi:two-component system, OmpR family, phosphate regulon sensor histidine kinase PhoR